MNESEENNQEENQDNSEEITEDKILEDLSEERDENEMEAIESENLESNESSIEEETEGEDLIEETAQKFEEIIEIVKMSLEEFEAAIRLEDIEGSFLEQGLNELEEFDTEPEETPEEEAARIERQVREFQKCQIEAALYASGKPLDIEILSTKLEIGKRAIEELLNELAFDYLERSTALVIAHVGDRYQMQIKPEYTEKVSKFAEGGAIAEKYLRTLTIIALKQPILKSLLVKLRGTGAYEHVKYLIDNALVDAKKKGRSDELTTTDKYAEMFGLPRDKNEMKRVMVAQLGLNEDGRG